MSDAIVPLRPLAGQSHTQGFGTQTTIAIAETSSTALAAQAKALVEAKFIMALHRPRDLDVSRQRILATCKRPAFAERALYSRPQGEKKIEGPSIRLAEECIRGLGNIDTQVMPIYEDDDKVMLVVAVIDLENNASYSNTVTIRKVVERKKLRDGQQALGKRANSYGDMVYLVAATDDDMLNKVNANVSKAVRTNGLRHVPADILEEAIATVKATMRKADKADPEAAKKKIIDAFAEIGVNVAALKEYVGHALDTLSPVEMDDLRMVFAAVRDGHATWQEYIEQRETERRPQTEQTASKSDSLKDKVRARAQQSAATTQPAAEAEPATEQPIKTKPQISREDSLAEDQAEAERQAAAEKAAEQAPAQQSSAQKQTAPPANGNGNRRERRSW